MSILDKIYWPAFFILLVYPPFLIILGIFYTNTFGVGWFEIILFILGYYFCNISVGIGLHRLWAHETYRANKYLEFVLILLSAGALQGPSLVWASDHYKHHTYTDKEKDPHSPQKYKNKFLGFLWSHIGWMIIGPPGYKNIDRVAFVKLGRNKLLKWQMKYYWQIATIMNTVVPALLGYIIGGSLSKAYGAFIFIGLGRALQQQATFAVNSLCHFLGSRNYYRGTAGDIWWLAIFLLGENWHNFHHAFPSDYRNGAKWYHLDVHKWIIYGLSKVGLATDLKITSDVRIAAKFVDTQKQMQEKYAEQLLLVKNKAQSMLERLGLQMQELENSSSNIKKNIVGSFLETQESLKYLIDQISQINFEYPSQKLSKLLRLTRNQLNKIEKTVYRIVNSVEITGGNTTN